MFISASQIIFTIINSAGFCLLLLSFSLSSAVSFEVLLLLAQIALFIQASIFLTFPVLLSCVRQPPTTTIVSLDVFLKDPVAVSSYESFLVSEFSVENLHFYVTVMEYQTQFSARSYSQNKAQAKRIYQEYLCQYAPNPINISADTKAVLSNALNQLQLKQPREATEQILLNLFEPAQREIYHLMSRDSFPRYFQSGLYKQYVTQSAQRSHHSVFVRVHR